MNKVLPMHPEHEKQTLNEIIKHRAEAKAELDSLNSIVSETKAAIEWLDKLLIQKMDTEEISRTANGNNAVSIVEETLPQVEDWETFYNYLSTTKDYSLLQKRVSSAAWREIIKLGESVPGVGEFTKRKISFRKLQPKL